MIDKRGGVRRAGHKNGDFIILTIVFCRVIPGKPNPVSRVYATYESYGLQARTSDTGFRRYDV